MPAAHRTVRVGAVSISTVVICVPESRIDDAREFSDIRPQDMIRLRASVMPTREQPSFGYSGLSRASVYRMSMACPLSAHRGVLQW
jgi:hypothetical protein